MGRKINLNNGKNIQSKSVSTTPRVPKNSREKAIIPAKMTTTLYEEAVIGVHRYHKRNDIKLVMLRSDAYRQNYHYLHCYNSDLLMCPGRGELDENFTFTPTNPHNPLCKDPFIREKAEYREAMYKRIKENPHNPKAIHQALVQEHPVGAQFSSYPAVKNSLLRWRNETQPPIPQSISDITEVLQCNQWIVTLSYEITVADQAFGTKETSAHYLQAWTATSGEGINIATHVIIGVPSYAQNFTDDDRVFSDCTFDVVPNVFGAYQLLTIMIEHRKKVLPVAWSIMQRKDEEAYSAVLKVIKENVLSQFVPMWGMTDFEPALQNGMSSVFPNLTIHGCLFHHCHGILKYSQKLKILAAVKHSETLRAEATRFQRDLMNIALLPAAYIAEAFEDLKERLGRNETLSEIMLPLFNYYDCFWISRTGPAKYSVYRETRKTNNAVERYHRALKEEMASKPEFYKFMLGLKKIQQEAHMNFIVLDHGNQPSRSNCKHAKLREEKLKQAWDELGQLSSYSREQRGRKFINFLNDVRPESMLARETSSLEEEDGLSNPPPTYDEHPDKVTNAIDEVIPGEWTNEGMVCRHFLVGCDACNAVPQTLEDKYIFETDESPSSHPIEEATVMPTEESIEEHTLLDCYSAETGYSVKQATAMPPENSVKKPTLALPSVQETTLSYQQLIDNNPHVIQQTVQEEVRKKPIIVSSEPVNINVKLINTSNSKNKNVSLSAAMVVNKKLTPKKLLHTDPGKTRKRQVITIPQQDFAPGRTSLFAIKENGIRRDILNANKRVQLQVPEARKKRNSTILCIKPSSNS